jgi:DNA-binding NtrC family response regulator
VEHAPLGGRRTPEDDEADAPTLLLRALEALAGPVIVVDRALRVVGATRAAARTLGAPISAGAHVVRVLSGGSGSLVADAFASDRATVATVPSGDASHELRARVRATPLRDGARQIGWIVRLAPETSRGGAPERLETMWARDEAMKRVFAMAQLLAECDASVVVSGEMGVGKASLAAAIHARSARHAQPLRTLACAAMSPALLEHQLLGRAPNGDAASTLLLDEVAELPHDAPGYLLRVLETGVATPIDGGPPAAVDVRTIATTRTSLDREVEEGRFRADLLVRLRTVSLEVPPLRARRADVPLLAEKFVAELNARGGRHIDRLGEDALARLQQHDWPGNVRELRVAIEAAFATGRGPVLVAADLPTSLPGLGAGTPEIALAPGPESTPADEPSRVRRALERAGRDRTRAAAMLGMSRTTLWRRMRAYGLAER